MGILALDLRIAEDKHAFVLLIKLYAILIYLEPCGLLDKTQGKFFKTWSNFPKSSRHHDYKGSE